MGKTHLGARIRELRGKRSLREFSEICGTSHTYIDYLEKGVSPRTGNKPRVSADVLIQIARRTKSDPMELFKLFLLDERGNT